MRLARAVALTALLSLVAVPSAGAQLPVGEADGVRIFRQHGIVVKFTAQGEKLRRRVAGHRITVMCTDLPAVTESFGSYVISNGGGTYRMPKRGRALRTGDLTRSLDYCRVELVRRRRSDERIVSVPLTQVGAVYLDEEGKAAELLELLLFAGFAAERLRLEAYPTYPQLEQFIVSRPDGPSRQRFSNVLVGLASTSDTPPVGKLGYYADGRERVVVAVVSASGRRLFIESEPDSILRSNVTGYIFGDQDF